MVVWSPSGQVVTVEELNGHCVVRWSVYGQMLILRLSSHCVVKWSLLKSVNSVVKWSVGRLVLR